MSEIANSIASLMRQHRSNDYTDLEHSLLDALWMVAFGTLGHGDGADLYMARTIAVEAIEQAGETIPSDIRTWRN